MTERERIIASLSPPELAIWFALFKSYPSRNAAQRDRLAEEVMGMIGDERPCPAFKRRPEQADGKPIYPPRMQNVERAVA